MNNERIDFYNDLQDRIYKLYENKLHDQAIEELSEVESEARAAHEEAADNDSLQELVVCLEIRANYLRESRKRDAAEKTYLNLIELIGDNEDFIAEKARIAASVGMLKERMGDVDGSIEYHLKSIELYESMAEARPVEVLSLCNNLAYIYKMSNRLSDAEDLYQKALEICRDNFGVKHESTAAVLNNLGAMYYSAGHIDEALEAHEYALDGRLESLSDDHLDCAQSFANLALCHVTLSNADAVKENFSRALEIYSKHAKAASLDYMSVAFNYGEFLRKQGEDELAREVEKAASQRLKEVKA